MEKGSINMITVEELKKCKKASDELVMAVKVYLTENFPDSYDCSNIEDNVELEIDGVSYGILETEDSGWTDEGKYSYSDKTYQLVSFDKAFGYVCDKSIIDRFDLFINQGMSRSGSYFTDYNYQYDSPTVQIAIIERVPEKIIKAHEEVNFINK